MARRSLTLLVSGVCAVALTAGAAAAQVPYVALGPGPTFDTLGQTGGEPVIEIDGRQTYPTDGRLDLTTVGVQRSLTVAEALTGWVRNDRAVVPRELVFPPDRTDAEIARENTRQMVASQSSAVTAALSHLGIPFTVDVVVGSVADALPAAGRLEPGDVLTAVDGTAVTGAADLRDRIQAIAPGTPVTLSYLRDGRPGEVRLEPAPAPDDSARSVIGVTLEERPEYGFDITIHLEDVGGPSAGLMFALGILDKLEPGSLTGGLHVAGTGEIFDDGTVGPIGGIGQKLLASGPDGTGADAFLVPAENCEEALDNAQEGLAMVRVETLTDAVEALRIMREGGTPPGCDA